MPRMIAQPQTMQREYVELRRWPLAVERLDLPRRVLEPGVPPGVIAYVWMHQRDGDTIARLCRIVKVSLRTAQVRLVETGELLTVPLRAVEVLFA